MALPTALALAIVPVNPASNILLTNQACSVWPLKRKKVTSTATRTLIQETIKENNTGFALGSQPIKLEVIISIGIASNMEISSIFFDTG